MHARVAFLVSRTEYVDAKQMIKKEKGREISRAKLPLGSEEAFAEAKVKELGFAPKASPCGLPPPLSPLTRHAHAHEPGHGRARGDGPGVPARLDLRVVRSLRAATARPDVRDRQGALA